MENKNYKGLRKALIEILKELEKVKKNGKSAIRYSAAIGNPLKKKTSVLMGRFDQLAHQCLKLEQETREI